MNKKYRKWTGIQKRLLVLSIAAWLYLRNGGLEGSLQYIILPVHQGKRIGKQGVIQSADATSARQKLDAVFSRVI